MNLPTQPFGARTDIMKDHAYVLERGHVFTSALVARKVTMSCYAMIVLTARGKPFSIQVGQDAREYRAVAIRPPIERAVYADDVRLTSFHLNPLHPNFRMFRSIECPGLLELPRASFAALDEALNTAYEGRSTIQQANELFESVIATASTYLAKPKPTDARIERIVARLQAGSQSSLKELAASVGLSANRMTHLFTETVGISLRSYTLWQKMHRVPSLLAAGKSFTETAHDCGFTDSAHMAAAFQNLYGAPPSYFFNSNHVRLVSWVSESSGG